MQEKNGLLSLRFYRNDTIKRVEAKTRFKYPEREYLSVSDAKIRHPNGARIFSDN